MTNNRDDLLVIDICHSRGAVGQQCKLVIARGCERKPPLYQQAAIAMITIAVSLYRTSWGHECGKVLCGTTVLLRHQGVIFTHRRSVAKRGGCFQRRMSVCQFVCLIVRTITSDRLNVGWWNWAVRCIVQKIAPEFEFGSQRLPGTKKRKTAESSPFTMHGKATRAV